MHRVSPSHCTCPSAARMESEASRDPLARASAATATWWIAPGSQRSMSAGVRPLTLPQDGQTVPSKLTRAAGAAMHYFRHPS
jgi:hypothetical protein